ncbi:MAG: FmdB family transcriptional regulator [Candidatus Eremiobacteraeota bacterium]|nr:FmdB family transcriptional regulator [Candidatus Eremiobacteraeota bacterium]
MPLYDYACTACGRVHEVRHGFDETYDRPCESCGAPMRRVFNPAPVLFKGSGFYVTDSRRSSATGTKSDKPKDETSTPKAESTKADATKAETPAASGDASTPSKASGSAA